jgi:hypothetical protein
VLSFADFGGRRLLSSLTFPDGVTTVSYGYDGSGNFAIVRKMPGGGGGGGLKISPAFMGLRGGKPPEIPSGTMTVSGFLRTALTFLGKGSKEVSKGRYVSADGLRQVRFGDHETKDPSNVHAHYESYDKPAGQGGKVTESSTVTIVPDHK